MMASLYLDPEEYLGKYLTAPDNDAALALGHIHLQVSNIASAKDFYVHLLGMQNMFELPTALFTAYDGYHHHLGLNTWHSLNAPQQQKNVTGLQSYTIKYHDTALFEAIQARLEQKNYPYTLVKSGELIVSDPFGLEVQLWKL
jgi:catechol 2,3-dioxygenase